MATTQLQINLDQSGNRTVIINMGAMFNQDKNAGCSSEKTNPVLVPSIFGQMIAPEIPFLEIWIPKGTYFIGCNLPGGYNQNVVLNQNIRVKIPRDFIVHSSTRTSCLYSNYPECTRENLSTKEYICNLIIILPINTEVIIFGNDSALEEGLEVEIDSFSLPIGTKLMRPDLSIRTSSDAKWHNILFKKNNHRALGVEISTDQ